MRPRRNPSAARRPIDRSSAPVGVTALLRAGDGARVLAVDDDPSARVAVRALLAIAGLLVVGEAGDAHAALMAVGRVAPTVVVAGLQVRRSGTFGQKVCIDEGVTPVGGSFPGDCTAVADGTFDECVGQRTACAFCRAINRADAIVPPADCDLFDDGVTNASCAN